MSPYSYKQIKATDRDASELRALCENFNKARHILTVEKDLEQVKQGVKTRKPMVYGHKVIVRR